MKRCLRHTELWNTQHHPEDMEFDLLKTWTPSILSGSVPYSVSKQEDSSFLKNANGTIWCDSTHYKGNQEVSGGTSSNGADMSTGIAQLQQMVNC